MKLLVIKFTVTDIGDMHPVLFGITKQK